MNSWLVVDTSFVMNHSYYSRALRDPKTAVVLTILDMQKLAVQFDAVGIAWVFDVKPYKRKELFSGYKSAQDTKKYDENELPLIKELKYHITRMNSRYLENLGYTNVFKQNGCEADDVIASVCKAVSPEDRITIVSRDHDLFQLITPRVSVYDPVSTRTITVNSFRREYNLHPSEWPEVKAIAGCGTDSIPGVMGVAEKTAMKFVQGISVGPKKNKAIEHFQASPEYVRNLKLVTLPYPGTEPVPALVRDGLIPLQAMVELVEELERPSMVDLVNRMCREKRVPVNCVE